MSEFFNDKDYSDYFRELEQRISSPEKRKEAKPSKSVPAKNKKKKARQRAAIRRMAALALCAFIVVGAVVFGVSSISSLVKKTGDTKKTEISSATASKDDVKKHQKQKMDYSLKFTQNTEQIGAEFESGSIVFVNRKTREVVAAKNSKEKLYPASTTKIMTLLVAVENITDLSDTFTMTYQITDPLYLADATVAGFSAGEVIGMTDLLYGTILPSGGDACIALAEKISGSEAEFVKLMNKKVKELGLKNTTFKNTTGLHAEGHYTTAEDLAVILSAAMENELCREILSTYKYTTASTLQHPDGILLESTLFSHMYGTEPEGADILGGKTGYTGEAGYCIAAFGKSESDNEYICVTLSGASKWPTYYNQIDLFSKYAK